MDEEFQKYEQIEAYLANKMPEQEQLIFEEKIKNDSSLAEEVELHALANDFVIEQRLLSVEQKIKALRPVKTSLFSVKNTLIGFVFLSSLLSLFFVFSDKKEAKQTEKTTIVIPEKKDSIETKDQVIEVFTESKKDTIVQIQEVTKKVVKTVVDIDSNIVNTTIIKVEKVEESKVIPIKTITEIFSLEKEKKQEVVVKENPCEKRSLTFALKSVNSCENVADGKVIVSTVEGGEKPYLYSINEKDYYSFEEFGGLLEGDYVVTVKDSQNCISKKTIVVAAKNCKEDKEYLLNPQFSVWEIPFNEEKNAFLKIMNKQGVTVYQQQLEINSYYEWNGRNQENTLLPLGLYIYLIEYEDGEIEQGYITLVR